MIHYIVEAICVVGVVLMLSQTLPFALLGMGYSEESSCLHSQQHLSGHGSVFQ